MVLIESATLPSVTSMYASRVDDREKSCNVTALMFDRSGINTEGLHGLLGGFKGLKNFEYLAPDETMANYDPRCIRAALLAHAQQTLETLVLRAHFTEKGYCHNGFIGSFRNFKVLKRLI